MASGTLEAMTPVGPSSVASRSERDDSESSSTAVSAASVKRYTSRSPATAMRPVMPPGLKLSSAASNAAPPRPVLAAALPAVSSNARRSCRPAGGAPASAASRAAAISAVVRATDHSRASSIRPSKKSWSLKRSQLRPSSSGVANSADRPVRMAAEARCTPSTTIRIWPVERETTPATCVHAPVRTTPESVLTPCPPMASRVSRVSAPPERNHSA